MDVVLSILWAYRTTYTPFLLAYRVEVVVPLMITHASPMVEVYELEMNEEGMTVALDLMDEVLDEAHIKIDEYQKKASFYYDLRV